MDIGIEIEKLGKFVNINEILKFEDYKLDCSFLPFDIKVKYLSYVLELTLSNPEIEIYLKQLLKNYSTTELDELDEWVPNFNILHQMVCELPNISLNSFDIIMKLGINVNSQNEYGHTPLHMLCQKPSERIQSVMGLFVKYGANLNILNDKNRTVLDEITYWKLNKHTHIIIMLAIDFGAKTNKPCRHGDILEFIESYRSSSIKPAIKK